MDSHDELMGLALLGILEPHDDLSGLLLPSALWPLLDAVAHATRREGTSLAILLGDVDRIFTINDDHGHIVGDACLRACGRALSGLAAPPRLAGRVGGDEFVIVAPRATPTSALALAEQARASIARAAEDAEQVLPRLTMSFGVALFPRDGADVQSALVAAQEASFAAKRAGRNCVRLAPSTWENPDG